MNFTRRTGIIILIFYAGGSTCFSSGQWTEGEKVEISINQNKKSRKNSRSGKLVFDIEKRLK